MPQTEHDALSDAAPITNDADHRTAIRRADAFMGLGRALSTEEDAEFVLLCARIEAYEAKRWPGEDSLRADALRELQQQAVQKQINPPISVRQAAFERAVEMVGNLPASALRPAPFIGTGGMIFYVQPPRDELDAIQGKYAGLRDDITEHAASRLIVRGMTGSGYLPLLNGPGWTPGMRQAFLLGIAAEKEAAELDDRNRPVEF